LSKENLEKSESKNRWFWLFQKPQRTNDFSFKESIILGAVSLTFFNNNNIFFGEPWLFENFVNQ